MQIVYLMKKNSDTIYTDRQGNFLMLDVYQFGVSKDWLIATCKTFTDITFNTFEELEKLLNINIDWTLVEQTAWDLMQKILDLAEAQSVVEEV